MDQTGSSLEGPVRSVSGAAGGSSRASRASFKPLSPPKKRSKSTNPTKRPKAASLLVPISSDLLARAPQPKTDVYYIIPLPQVAFMPRTVMQHATQSRFHMVPSFLDCRALSMGPPEASIRRLRRCRLDWVHGKLRLICTIPGRVHNNATIVCSEFVLCASCLEIRLQPAFYICAVRPAKVPRSMIVGSSTAVAHFSS